MNAVVTGVGVIAPNGVGTEAYWASTLAGYSAIGRLTAFDPSPYPSTLAGEITALDPAKLLPSRLVPSTDRMTRLSLLAAEWALADAVAVPSELDGDRVGVVTSASAGGFEFGERELRKLWLEGAKHVSAYQSYAWFYAVNSGQISIRHGMRGASGTIVADDAGGLDALAQSRRQIRDGSELILSGGVDSCLCPWGWVAQMSARRLTTSIDPRRAYRPFDADADGHILGEGGAHLVVESANSAAARGVTSYGYIAGHAATTDPRPGTSGEPGLRRAIELCLDDAGLTPADVDVVFADAAALPELDAREATAIGQVFGTGAVPVTAPKTMTGRLGAGGAALDVATALLSIRDATIPPTVGVNLSKGYGLDLVTNQPRPARLRTALVLARGHGGFNSALLLGAPDQACARSVPSDQRMTAHT